MIDQVAGGAGSDRGERPLPAILLGRHEHDQQLACEPVEVTGSPERPDGRDDRRHAAFHVAGAPAVQLAIADLGGPRVDMPGGGIAHRNDVEVTGEDDPATALPAGPAEHDRQRRAGHFPARPGRVGPERIVIRGDLVDDQAGSSQGVRCPCRSGLLRSGDAGDPDQLAQVIDHPLAIDR